ncbi:SpdA protein [Embleya sp. NPDC020630]|uniref:SpdA protein n=1 Tax=Embleya sp. NPDC020630 TaxID=3363979 RepID=UPI00379CF62A
MSTSTNTQASSPLRAVTWIMGAVIGLTFRFGFGNVWALALRLDVTAWVAPLVAPAVDPSVLGLLLAVRHLALNGATREQLRRARGLLIFSSLITLALNVADPLIAGEFGKATFDAVDPLLLIGWAEVGPSLLQCLKPQEDRPQRSPESDTAPLDVLSPNPCVVPRSLRADHGTDNPEALAMGNNALDIRLLIRAREENACHWATHQRPISAEVLRKSLHVGAAKARALLTDLRREAMRHVGAVERIDTSMAR